MSNLTQQIDALLPQTQCGQCGYAGCMPYAKAIAEKNETLNHCPPGGVKTLKALGELLQQDITSYIAEMQAQEKPLLLANIREAECIGCTKCIQACPVDAIIGAAKQLHVILTDECTGCGLCVAPCPVDCIDMITVDKLTYNPEQARARFNVRNLRLEKIEAEKNKTKVDSAIAEKRDYIAAAVARVKTKKKN